MSDGSPEPHAAPEPDDSPEPEPDATPEPHAAPDADRTRRGYLYLAAAAFTFSLMAVQVKIGGRTLPVEMLMLGRCAVTLVASTLTLHIRKVRFRGKDEKLLVLRGLFGLAGLVSWFYALTRLPLADVTVIHFMHPILTTVLAARLLGERVSLSLAGALAFGLLGTLLVARPPVLFGGGAALDPAGLAAAVVSAITSACAYVVVRRVSRTDDPDVIVFYFPLVATPLLAPFVIARWVWPTPLGWLLLFTVGLTTHVSQVLLTRGLSRVAAGRATTLGYTQILYAVVWGMLFFHEAPPPSTMLGALAIGLAALLLLRGGNDRGGERPRGERPRGGTTEGGTTEGGTTEGGTTEGGTTEGGRDRCRAPRKARTRVRWRGDGPSMARPRDRRGHRGRVVPRRDRDPAWLAREIRARQAERPLARRSHPLQLGHLPGELRIRAAHLLRGRRSARRAGARPRAGGTARRDARARRRPDAHAR